MVAPRSSVSVAVHTLPTGASNGAEATPGTSWTVTGNPGSVVPLKAQVSWAGYGPEVNTGLTPPVTVLSRETAPNGKSFVIVMADGGIVLGRHGDLAGGAVGVRRVVGHRGRADVVGLGDGAHAADRRLDGLAGTPGDQFDVRRGSRGRSSR